MATEAHISGPSSALSAVVCDWSTSRLAWNSLEAVSPLPRDSLPAASRLSGLDLIRWWNVLSGAVLVWRLRTDEDVHRRERVEQISLRLVGISFLVLAAYVACEAIEKLMDRRRPRT